MNRNTIPEGPSSSEAISEKVVVPTLGLAIASLVLGILSIALSIILIGILLGIVGLALGIAHLLKKPLQRAMAWWGVSLSIVGILVGWYLGSQYYKFYTHFREAMESYQESGSGSLDEWVGTKAPDFTVKDLNGKTITLSELKGRRVILDFWATWCPPCRKEIPHFIELRNMTGEEELMIIGISSEKPNKLASFAMENKINYPLASAKDLPSPFSSVTAIPTTFFIDRNGIIQNILVGYHSLEDLKSNALAPDYEGTAKEEPGAAASGLTTTTVTLKLVPRWELSIPGAEGMCVGDWNLDGETDVLVTDNTSELHVIDTSGKEIVSHTLPTAMPFIDYGLIKSEPVLLGYSIWGKEVTAVDRQGKKLWSYAATMGVNGAHWGDLDGDGNDEMIVGMNGFGGLRGVDEDGKKLWKVSGITNVWNQSVISASDGRPAMVFATEAGGTIRVFDGAGKGIRTIRPLGMYFNPIRAEDIDGKGIVQITGIGSALRSRGAKKFSVVAFDPQGTVTWQTPIQSDPGAWVTPQFACGDIDGDGVREWAFVQSPGKLVIASHQGEEIASLSIGGRPDRIGIISLTDRKETLVLLQNETLSAYSAE